jgi:hypothetical protein
MQPRMTAQSRENLKVADRAEVLKVDAPGAGYLVKIWRGERCGFLTSGDGFVMTYPSVGASERAVTRIRPDLVPILGAAAVAQ